MGKMLRFSRRESGDSVPGTAQRGMCLDARLRCSFLGNSWGEDPESSGFSVRSAQRLSLMAVSEMRGVLS